MCAAETGAGRDRGVDAGDKLWTFMHFKECIFSTFSCLRSCYIILPVQKMVKTRKKERHQLGN